MDVRVKNMSGRRYGKWLVLSYSRMFKTHALWNCRCDCGNKKEVLGYKLRRGETTSCGCSPYRKNWCPEIVNTTCIIPISQGKSALIDAEDIDKVKFTAWSFSRGYVVGWVNGKVTSLHRLVMGFPERGVDHINRNTLDNRKCNLRVSTQSENMRNRPKPCSNTTGYKGVSKRKSGRFFAQITHNYKNICLGTYDTAEEASIAYKNKAREIQGEFYYGPR